MILVIRLRDVEAHYTHDFDRSKVDYFVIGGIHYETFEEYLLTPGGQNETVESVKLYFQVVYNYIKKNLDIITLAVERDVLRLECDITSIV